MVVASISHCAWSLLVGLLVNIWKCPGRCLNKFGQFFEACCHNLNKFREFEAWCAHPNKFYTFCRTLDAIQTKTENFWKFCLNLKARFSRFHIRPPDLYSGVLLDMTCITHCCCVQHNVLRNKVSSLGFCLCHLLVLLINNGLPSGITSMGCAVVLYINNTKHTLLGHLFFISCKLRQEHKLSYQNQHQTPTLRLQQWYFVHISCTCNVKDLQ